MIYNSLKSLIFPLIFMLWKNQLQINDATSRVDFALITMEEV